MSKILYTIGDSVVWGAELRVKEKQRFSHHLAKKLNAIDCNNATAGVSNDYIFRHCIRDIMGFINTNQIWSEESGWVEGDELIVVVGWTSPTRFEWWTGNQYQQERLWTGYDKWGDNDKDRTTEDKFVLNQTEDIPSYIRTFNQILSVKNICENNNITNKQFNSFYHYHGLYEPVDKIDRYGREENQIGMTSLWAQRPNEFRKESMYEHIQDRGGKLLQRNHPNLKSHKIWSYQLYNLIEEQNNDEF